MFALLLVGSALFVTLPQILSLTLQPAQNDAANQVALMQAAATSYIKNHFNSLAGSITVGGATPITPSQLIADGDLESSFNDSNVFGQHHILVVAQPSAGILDGMVFTYGGDTIPDLVALRVAQAGPANSVVLLASDSANFEGAAGGQTIAVSGFSGAGYTISPGHLGAHIEPANYAAESPFLNRYYTGNIDDNSMHTNLLMAGNNITGAGIVSATQQVITPMVVDPTTPSYQITPAGNSTINNLVVNGAITATDYLHLSDARLKTDIGPIDDPVALVAKLTGHRFTWRKDGREDIGFIAQEVQESLPEAVRMTEGGLLAVKYDVLAAPLTEAIKQQSREISLQAAEIDRLQRQIEVIEKGAAQEAGGRR
jgi:hypothetical protein